MRFLDQADVLARFDASMAQPYMVVLNSLLHASFVLAVYPKRAYWLN